MDFSLSDGPQTLVESARQDLDGGRINTATCSIGSAQKTLKEAATYFIERKLSGLAIAGFLHTQFALVYMLTALPADDRRRVRGI